MSTVGSSLLACPDVQAELDRYFITCGHTGHRESPFLQFVTSAENQSGLSQVISPGGGKVRTVVLRYDQKITTASFNEISSCDLVCTSTNKVGDMNATYEIDPCERIQYDEGYNLTDLASICRTNEEFLMSRINAMAMGLEAKIAEKTAEEVQDLVGDWASDVSGVTGNTLAVATLLSGGINLDPRFMSKINLAQMKTGYCTSSAIFGSSALWEAADNLNIGCCADSGYDLFAIMQRYGKLVMWDPYITAAYGSDLNAVSTQLGAVQLLTYTDGRSPMFTPIASAYATNFEVIPMETPRYGIPFDLVVANNCGVLSLSVSTTTKLVAAPFDLFPVGDVQEGVNFVNNLQVVNP